MALYTRESRDRVRDAVDFVELVSARTDLRRAGAARYEGLCPFHEERTPSFGIDPAQKVYYCFGCQAAGDVFTFVQETEGVDFKGALELLADRYGVELELEREDPEQAQRRERRERLLELLARTSAYYQRCLWDSSDGARAREQLAERNLSEEVLREFAVGYAPSAWNRVLSASRRGGFSVQELCATGLAQRSRENGQPYDRFRARITFPLADMRGRVLGFGARAVGADQQPKYLNTADNDIYHKGRHLYGAHLARPHATRAGVIILCEGYTDVIALHQAGIRNAVGLMGTALTGEQVAELGRMASTVLLALDADAAGQNAMLRAADLAARRRLDLRVVALPAGTDPAELVQREGATALEAAVAEAVPFERFRVERVLAAGDHSGPEGKDRMLDELRPVFDALAPSALRMELMRLVSGRLALSESLVETVLSGEGGGRRGAGRAGAVAEAGGTARAARPGTTSPAGGGGEGAAAALSRAEETERAFLALCIALPDEGATALEQADIESCVTSDLMCRAARHLREHLRAPLADGDEDLALDRDPELKALLAKLIVQAGREEPNSAMLRVQRLQLELARIDREIQAARLSGAGSEEQRYVPRFVADSEDARPAGDQPAGATELASSGISVLAARRAEVKHEFDRAYARVLEETGERGE
ncbi:MAG TPA: DNA primase [Solirubrobacteraceae bacterium]|nr:DNA primase [Solirubrobacteraceae bacterium]